MNPSTGGTQREKPGRLHLAILEWQRQLIEKREAERRVAEPRYENGIAVLH